MRHSIQRSLCLVSFAVACSVDAPRPGAIGDAGSNDASVAVDSSVGRDATVLPPSDGGGGGDSCTEDRARWIYLLTSGVDGGELLRYEPDQNRMTTIGALNCPASPLATPFSMAVDRNARAWVHYSDGSLFYVDTATAACTASGFQTGQQGFEQFGMGFVSNGAGATSETLFIAGGDTIAVRRNSMLGTIDANTLQVMRRGSGQIDGSPELTGNGNGELWGFFPNVSPMVVRQLDVNTGATMQEHNVSTIAREGETTAWAFAYWGGRYYIFYAAGAGGGLFGEPNNSGIFRLTPETGVVETRMEDSGHIIVGAGVSTCAPTLLI